MQIKKFQNIIFDLGGVILNIDEHKTIIEFARLSQQTPEEIIATMKLPEHQMVLQHYEMGKINTGQFRQQLSAFAKVQVADKAFDKAWNMVLMDIPLERIKLLKRLKTTHRIFLLSNTNDLHWQHFNQILAETSQLQNFDELFEKTYYSFQLGCRKPDKAIYQHVLQDNNLNPAKTIMFDDLQENLDGAESAGIHTYTIERNQLPLEIFYE
mgnify:CR=1 FL=1